VRQPKRRCSRAGLYSDGVTEASYWQFAEFGGKRRAVFDFAADAPQADAVVVARRVQLLIP
jgi:hypothetical protein